MRIGQKNGFVVCFIAVTLVLVNPCYADSDYSGVDYSNPTPGYALMAAGGVGILASLLAVFLTSAKGSSPDVPSVPVVTGKLSIFLNQDSQDLHLGYRSIKIQNNGDSTLTMDQVSVKIPDVVLNKIKYCSPSDVTCRYKTDSNCTAGSVLDVGGSCRVWFKALNNDTDGLTTASGAIDVQVTADSSEYSQGFNVAYEKALYVGGSFTLAGSSPASNLAKWDGSAWFADFAGTDGQINALTVGSDGDLYVGGSFASAGGNPAANIAKWNGASWSGIGSGTNGQVNALAADTDGNLYTGGTFTSAGGNVASNIAKWNGVLWSDIGGTNNAVNALIAGLDGYLYVGGSSDYATGQVARWQINSSLWSNVKIWDEGAAYALAGYGQNIYFSGDSKGHFYIGRFDGSSPVNNYYGTNSGNKILAIAAVADGVYVGGVLSGMGTALRNIAKWDGSSQSFTALGEEGVDDTVRALVNVGNILYVGGDLTYHIASWDGSTWRPLGDGLNGSVYALTTLASMKFLE